MFIVVWLSFSPLSEDGLLPVSHLSLTDRDADKDAWRFTPEADLPPGSVKDGLRWRDPTGAEWWPAVQGEHFYNLSFPLDSRLPTHWVNGNDMRNLAARRNPDRTSVMEHYRLVWRDIARSVDERSAIATVLPPRVAAKDKAPTVWGGSLDSQRVLALAALMTAFVFDYLVRFRGVISLKYGILNQITAPSFDAVRPVLTPTAEVVCQHPDFAPLWEEVCPGVVLPRLDAWSIAEHRARIDAEVAVAYGLSLIQYAAVLSTFPNLDRVQPMLPGEAKSFVTRDLALSACSRRLGLDPPDLPALLESIGISGSMPRDEYRSLGTRIDRYRQIGAVPYRPSPKGGRTPDDPELVAAIRELLSDQTQTARDLAAALDEDEPVVKTIAERLVREDPVVYVEGRGARRRYYVVEEE